VAVTITVAALAAELGETVTVSPQPETDGDVTTFRAPNETVEGRVTRVHAVACERVDGYAPDAPDSISNEGVVRYAAYLLASQATAGAIIETNLGVEVKFAANHGLAFRNSGAEALLAPWKVRDAGVIG